jgi:hypothetical protein
MTSITESTDNITITTTTGTTTSDLTYGNYYYENLEIQSLKEQLNFLKQLISDIVNNKIGFQHIESDKYSIIKVPESVCVSPDF